MDRRAHLISTLFTFLVGILCGYIFKDAIYSVIGGEGQAQYCPAVSTVLSHKSESSPWMDADLQWSPLTQPADLPDNLLFNQVILQRAGNTMVCYYRYQRPGFVGTFDHYLLQLNPASNQKIKAYGEHWNNNAISASCISNDVRTCGFNVDYAS